MSIMRCISITDTIDDVLVIIISTAAQQSFNVFKEQNVRKFVMLIHALACL